ncbi:MAG: hypothetical protein EXR96_09145 [Nitrospiraceae bacterium]|nr:hypothetical protein [Nitrospiraceae bacterium]
MVRSPLVEVGLQSITLLKSGITSARVELARTLGISDVAVSKWCGKLRIPVPGRGYWAKLAAGHKLPVPPLAQPLGNGRQGQERAVRTKHPVGGENVGVRMEVHQVAEEALVRAGFHP